MPLSYLLGAAILLPGLFSMVELATAMPKAGGIYYFLDRSMGPLVGTIGGFGTWIAVVLKSAFALIGVGAYLQLFFPSIEMGPMMPCSNAPKWLVPSRPLVGPVARPR